MLHLLPRPSTARSRSSSTAQERALGRICAGKGLSVSRGGTQRGMQGGSGICFQLLATGIRQSCPWGRSRRGSSWVLGVAPPQWGPRGLSPAPQNRAVEHRRSKGAARDPLCPLERGRGHAAARFPNLLQALGPLWEGAPCNSTNPKARTRPRDSRSAFLQAPTRPRSLPTPKLPGSPNRAGKTPKLTSELGSTGRGCPDPLRGLSSGTLERSQSSLR